MTNEETLTMQAARITRAATIMRTQYKPWERLKALDDIETSVILARRLLQWMQAAENASKPYGPEVERNGRREME